MAQPCNVRLTEGKTLRDLRKQTLAVMRAQPNPEAILLLERMLEWAKTGEINFVMVLGTSPDGSVYDGWAGGKDLRPYTIAGALAAVQHQFMLRNIE